MASSFGPVRVVLAVALAAGCGGDVDRDAPAVLLVTLDTTRADHVGAYGATLGATPHLDALAAQGLVVERAWATAPITLPSHTSILSGAWPPVHGVRDNGLFVVPPRLVLLPEVLHEEGWRTAAFVAAFVLDQRFGLDQGFEVYDGPPVPLRDIGPGDAQRRAGEVVDAALDWLDVPGDEPLLLWCHFFDAHLTYDPPAPFREDFANAYDGEIAYADSQLGRLVDAFTARTAGRPRLVVVVGDHGESLGEHGELTHGVFVYDATLRVPLVVWGTGVEPGRLDAPASLVDVAPTILAWAGIDAGRLPDAAGLSLLPRAGAPAVPRDRPLLIESELPWHGHGWAPVSGVVVWPHKSVGAPRPELYDLAADPHERDDLAAARPDLAAELQAREADLRSRLEAAGRARRTELSALDEAMLRALGYAGHLDDAGAPPDRAGIDPHAGIAALARREQVRYALWRGRRLLGLSSMLADAMPPPALDAEQLARRQAGLAEVAEARARLSALCADDPDDPELAALAGLAAVTLGDVADGARRFADQARLAPRAFAAHFNLGVCLARLGREPEAEVEMAAAFRCDRRRLEVVEWFEQRLLARDAFGAAAWLLRDFVSWAQPRRLGEEDRALVQRLDARAARHAAMAEVRGQVVAPPPGLSAGG